MSNNARYQQQVFPNEFSERGWQDYIADPNRAYPKEFDGWAQHEQRDYERGRLRAAGWRLRFRFGRIPKHEPADIIQQLDGLGLVPPKHECSTRRRRRRGSNA